MSEILIKPNKNIDEYVIWSPDINMPVSAPMTREEVYSMYHSEKAYSEIETMVDDADRHGVSDSWEIAHWDQLWDVDLDVVVEKRYVRHKDVADLALAMTTADSFSIFAILLDRKDVA